MSTKAKLKVLVVDDMAAIRKQVAAALKDNFEVTVALSVPQANASILASLPDVVITDIRMPNADGFSFLKELRAQYPKMPVILMTGHGDKKIVVEAIRNGAFDYLEKPFVEEELANVMNRAAEKIHLERELLIAQASVVQSSKMAALGDMAGGLAHEINTPLSSILFVAEEIRDMALRKEWDYELLEQMSATLSSTTFWIASIVKALRSFSRNDASDPPQKVLMSALLDECMVLCQEKLKNSNVDLRFTCEPENAEATCYPVQLSQVLLNLIGNSCDAIKGTKEAWIRIRVAQKDGRIRIRVSDSGTGIPKEVADRIFEPFFTTKDVGSGTGLGLSISKGLLESQGGSLMLDTQAKNTTFVIEFPDAALVKKVA